MDACEVEAIDKLIQQRLIMHEQEKHDEIKYPVRYVLISWALGVTIGGLIGILIAILLAL
jgi:hypothetical protein